MPFKQPTETIQGYLTTKPENIVGKQYTPEKYLTKPQVKQTVENAMLAGWSPEQTLKSLTDEGYVLEGMGAIENQSRKDEVKRQKAERFTNRVKDGVFGPIARSIGAVGGGIEGLAKGAYEGVVNGGKDFIDDSRRILKSNRYDNIEKFNKILLGEFVLDYAINHVVGDTIFGGLEGAFNGFTTDREKEKLSEKSKEVIAEIVKSKPAKKLTSMYAELEPEEQQEVNEFLDYSMGAVDLIGVGLGGITGGLAARATREGIEQTGKQTFKSAIKAAQKAGTIGLPKIKRPAIIDDLALNISAQVTGISPESIRFIKEAPEIAEKAIKGEIKGSDITEEIVTLIDELDAGKRELGSEYEMYRAILGKDVSFSKQEMLTDAIKTLEDDFSVKYIDGKFDLSASNLSDTNFDTVQRMFDVIKKLPQNPPIKILHNKRQVIDQLYKENANSVTLSAQNAMRDVIDSRLNKVPGFKELDTRYKLASKEMRMIKKNFFDREGAPKTRLENVKLLLNSSNANSLRMLEKYSPGITKRIEALRMVSDIEYMMGRGVGAYSKGILSAAGISFFGGASVGETGMGAKTALGLLILTNPRVTSKLLLKYVKLRKGVKNTIEKIGKGLAPTDSEFNDLIESLNDDIKSVLERNVKYDPTNPSSPINIDASTLTNDLSDIDSGFSKLDIANKLDDSAFNTPRGGVDATQTTNNPMQVKGVSQADREVIKQAEESLGDFFGLGGDEKQLERAIVGTDYGFFPLNDGHRGVGFARGGKYKTYKEADKEAARLFDIDTGAPVAQEVANIPQDLLEEARKYKSADEFVDNRFVKRGLSPATERLLKATKPEQPYQYIGTVGDFIIDPRLRKQFGDVLDVRVFRNQLDDFGQRAGRYRHGRNTIEMDMRAFSDGITENKIEETLWEEIIHAHRKSKGRDFDDSVDYLDRIHEASAKRGKELIMGDEAQLRSIREQANK